MTDDQEPTEPATLEDVGSSSKSDDKVSAIAENQNTLATSVPSPSSTSVSVGDDDDDQISKEIPPEQDNLFSKNNSSMTFVDEIEQGSDDEGQMNNSTDTGFLLDEREIEAAAIESEYYAESNDDSENDTKSYEVTSLLSQMSSEPEHLRGLNQPSTSLEDTNSIHSVDLFDPPSSRSSKPLLAAAKKAKQQADAERGVHLEGLNQPTKLFDEDRRNSIRSVDLFDPQPTGPRASRPLVAAAKKAKQQADAEKGVNLEGLNQPTKLFDEDRRNSLHSVDLFDPQPSGPRASRPLVAAAKKAKQQADVEKGVHLEGLNQPSSSLDEDRRNSLHSVDLFDPQPSGPRASKPLVAAAKKAKQQADVERGVHLEGLNQPTKSFDEDRRNSLHSVDLFDPQPTGPRASRPLVAAAKKAKQQADAEKGVHLEGLNQPSSSLDEDRRNSLHSVDLFDAQPTSPRASKPLVAAAKKAKQQADAERGLHLEGLHQPPIIDEEEGSLELYELFDSPATELRASKPLLAAALKAKEQADQMERGSKAKQPATIIEEEEEMLDGSESNHAETENGYKELTSKSQDKDKQNDEVQPRNDDKPNGTETKSVHINLDDAMPNKGVAIPPETESDGKEQNRGINASVESHLEAAINAESSLVHTGRKNHSSTSANGDSSSWRGVVIGLTVCFFFIIAAQGITIGILSGGDDDDNVGVASNRGTAPLSTDAPTVSPTATQTSGTGFRSIANEPGAVRLDLISDCSESCTESFEIPDGFDLRWSMSDFVSLMSISSNGGIILECDFFGTCGLIETLGHSLGQGIDTSIEGNIFVLPQMPNDDIGASTLVEQNPSVTVSWEKLQLSADLPAEDEFQVSIQVTIQEGKIEICYGEGNVHGDSLVASFLNFMEGTSEYPDGYPFYGEGLADQFPRNQCFAFGSNGNTDGWTLTPTSSFTWFPGGMPYPPTMAPTNPSFTGFVSLSSIEGAIPLTAVSSCDDCYENVPLPTETLWDGKYTVSSLLVSSNGYLELIGGDGTEYARINVVSMDLDTSRDSDLNVRYFRREASGVTIVSWENMQLFGASTSDNSRVNGQVLIHPEGRIDICWGDITLDNEFLEFESNIYGYVDGSSYFATGPYFDSLGRSNGNSLPLNACQTLTGDSKQTVSALYSNDFTSLSAVQGATRLATVSALDDTEQTVDINVPIRWVQDSFSDQLVVSSNGVIGVDGCYLENSECGAIAVASADLDPSSNGDVWFLDATQLEDESPLLDQNLLYIISWENVALYSFPLSRINAQALFYEDGTIEICFGASKAFEVQVLAGVFDPRFNIDEPAWGEGFFSFGGSTEMGVWPTGLCQSFYVATSGSLPIPSMPPMSLVSPAPIDTPGFAPSCMPTSGACVSTDSDLVRGLNESRPGDTVALCGDMIIPLTISVEVSNMTICCVRESLGCSLDGGFETQIMSVSGANFTMIGVKFQNGVSNQNGGNLAIDAPGHHSIRNCSFSGGQTSFMFGGNLYVANSDSISISGSSFNIGTAPLGGSGVAFENTWSIDIQDSKFQNNFGQGAGGGVLVYHSFDSLPVDAPIQLLHIQNSTFEENSAEIGAGVAVQDVDAINLAILQSVFAFNGASVVGGALSITGVNSTIANLRGNSGEGNSDGLSTCNDFFFDENMDYEDGICFNAGDTIQLSDEDFEPDITLTPSIGPDEIPVCSRTFPTCAETEDDLKSMLLDAKPNDVISLCGGMVSVSETLQVSQLNVTLCCEAYPRCTLSGTNLSAPVMSVSQGGNFTAIGLRFQGGVNENDGGNLLIDAPGYHSILFCEFLSGFSEAYGGNLYVGNAHSVNIAYSHFNSGRAIGGGAAAFIDTAVVSIKGSEIVGNSAGFEGGGLLFLSNDENSEMALLINGTAFEDNSATEGGGGFAVRGMGSVRFNLIDSWFYDNAASAEGASGMISVSKVLDFNLEGNFGDSNIDTTNRCEWIFVDDGSSDISDVCFNLNSEAPAASALELPTSPP